MRGGEKVLLSLARLFPGAPIFTLLHVRGTVHPELEARWGEWVPVLLHGEHELCHYHLDEAAVRAYLGGFPLESRA